MSVLILPYPLLFSSTHAYVSFLLLQAGDQEASLELHDRIFNDVWGGSKYTGTHSKKGKKKRSNGLM